MLFILTLLYVLFLLPCFNYIFFAILSISNYDIYDYPCLYPMLARQIEELSSRFIIPLPPLFFTTVELLYFKLEEAHWFYLDFYHTHPKSKSTSTSSYKKFGLRPFSQLILESNNIYFDENDYQNFLRYKKNLPVYGSLLINQSFDKILLVSGYYNDQLYFPKGKIEKNETPKQCAIRETIEEIGYDITNKVFGREIVVGSNFSVFIVINVNERLCFKTRTRMEIRDIKWVPIEHVLRNRARCYKQITRSYKCCERLIEKIKMRRFRIDVDKLEKCFEKIGIMSK